MHWRFCSLALSHWYYGYQSTEPTVIEPCVGGSCVYDGGRKLATYVGVRSSGGHQGKHTSLFTSSLPNVALIFFLAVVHYTDCDSPGLIHRMNWLIEDIWLLDQLIDWLIDQNSLWLNDTMWRHRSGSTLAQAMTCCLMAPSHYLVQCCCIINEVLEHSQDQFSRKCSRYEFIKMSLKIHL